jgi:hypothetical protein
MTAAVMVGNTVLRYSIRLSQVTDLCAEPKFGLGHSVTWLSAGDPERSQKNKNKNFFPAGQNHPAENAVCRNFRLVTGHVQLRRKVQFGAEVTGHTQRRIEYRSTVFNNFKTSYRLRVSYLSKPISVTNATLTVQNAATGFYVMRHQRILSPSPRSLRGWWYHHRG